MESILGPRKPYKMQFTDYRSLTIYARESSQVIRDDFVVIIVSSSFESAAGIDVHTITLSMT